jgi:flagellar biosynthetic protein FlhB
VVAKGADHIAERIKAVAREHNVPLVENQPLAQALYKMADLGDDVPVDLYRAVAEVLAYVYRLKGKHSL